MRPWQNILALLATVVAAGTLLPLPPILRVACAAVAGVIVLLLLLARVRAHRVRRDRDRVDGIYEHIERIRADRARRRGSR
jgi:Flp pilus assembly protein TadB